MRAIRSSVEDGETRKIRSRPSRVRGRDPLPGLVGRQVGRDRAGPAGGGQVAGEAVRPVLLDQVPVGHHHGRGAGAGDRLDGGEGVPGPDPARQRPGAGALDGDPVHHRVAVGHADLDQVDPGRGPRRRTGPGARPARSARRGSRRAGSRPAPRDRWPGRRRTADRCARASCSQLLAGPGRGAADLELDRRQAPAASIRLAGLRPVPEVSRSNHLIAVSTSLSPRPDRLTRIIGGCRRPGRGSRRRA